QRGVVPGLDAGVGVVVDAILADDGAVVGIDAQRVVVDHIARGGGAVDQLDADVVHADTAGHRVAVNVDRTGGVDAVAGVVVDGVAAAQAQVGVADAGGAGGAGDVDAVAAVVPRLGGIDHRIVTRLVEIDAGVSAGGHLAVVQSPERAVD